jgi:hypothetical protein
VPRLEVSAGGAAWVVACDGRAGAAQGHWRSVLCCSPAAPPPLVLIVCHTAHTIAQHAHKLRKSGSKERGGYRLGSRVWVRSSLEVICQVGAPISPLLWFGWRLIFQLPSAISLSHVQCLIPLCCCSAMQGVEHHVVDVVVLQHIPLHRNK